MDDNLAAFETWIGELVHRLGPAERRKLARAVATDLRRDQAERIAAQQNPDGSAFAPRKKPGGAIRARKGQVRRRAEARKAGPMFRKLRRANILRAEATPAEASVGFRGAATSRIARVHQEGLRDQVSRDPGAPVIKYPARVLLGFTAAYPGRLLDLVLAHLEV